MKAKRKYFWECSWDNGHGAFSPDREACSGRGRAVHSTALAAAKAGAKHDNAHGWGGWGSAPLGWRNESTRVFYRTPKGRLVVVGRCAEIVAKG
jgi:hypothetical protein